VPVADPSWRGVDDPNTWPSDSYGAIGPHSYIEMVNSKIAIYTRTGDKIASGTLSRLTGSNAFQGDVQIIWDPHTERFYYAHDDFDNNLILWGFSKGPNPTAIPGDFCTYSADFGYGSNIPDYPKLGQTVDFLLIGINNFTADNEFVGADLAWIAKPQSTATVTTCPDESTFRLGVQQDLRNMDGSRTNTPVPAIQTDPAATGWVVGAADLAQPGASADFLTLFTVTKNPDGTANVPPTGQAIPVPAYSIPPNAPQRGSLFELDTFDGRLRHAVAGFDPARVAMGIWTSHAVAGGAGAEERWYEIDALTGAVLQQGAATSASLYVFNGAISPDRKVMGATRAFGSSMVMGFSTSGEQAYPAIQMVSKVGFSAQSAFVKVKQSPGPYQGQLVFDCVFNLVFQAPCRWGDYSGASADPAADPNGSTGKVWLTNQWASGDIRLIRSGWRTWNWGSTP
jgi:hypothetical protein